MKKILERILKFFAVDILRQYAPFIVGVTGSMGKTSTKEAIFAVLSFKYKVRRNVKNYNNEIGVPLTILGEESGGSSLFKWLGVFLRSAKKILFKSEYPKVLILEMGADKPGDIKYLTSFVDCNVGVITGVGDIPVHVEFFGTPTQVAREKAKLIEYLYENDVAVLNFDDERVMNLANKTRAKVLTYGVKNGAQIRGINYELDVGLDPSVAGIKFKIEHEGRAVSFKKQGLFGAHQVYPILAAAGVGLAFGMSIEEIVSALENYEPPKGRMRLIDGIKQTWILDDSYNASPSATIAALETLKRFEGRRKIAVLGDMLELGQFTESAHRKIGEKARECADLFFAIGDRMKFAVDAARKKRMAKQKIFWFETADEARLPLQMLMQKGDVILAKGSQSMRLEKIVEEIMGQPEKAGELLVRQDAKWKK